MALHHAASGELIDIRALGPALRETISTTLVRADHLEVYRLVMPAGAQVPQHKLPRNSQLAGISTIQCLEGAVDLTVNGACRRMHAGSLIYLAAGATHALSAIEDSAVLVTMLIEHD